MFKKLERDEILYDWDSYRELILQALNESVGAKETIGFSDNAIDKIFKKLTNPFNTSMQLWIQKSDDLNYVVLTQIQKCEFTQRRSLLWFSSTRARDLDTETVLQAYQEGEEHLKQFAKANQCEGISGYSDLEYFAKKVKEDWGAITRYFFYLPLQEAV